jgi:hypothetical protein
VSFEIGSGLTKPNLGSDISRTLTGIPLSYSLVLAASAILMCHVYFFYKSFSDNDATK